MKIEIISKNVNDTNKIASVIAEELFVGSVITLNGDLGAGKTTFAQGIGNFLGIKSKINSPTFNILKCYFDGKIPLYHIDAYRLEDNINSDIGLEEVIQGDGICIIEWSIFIEKMVFEPLNIIIDIIDENQRKFIISSDYDKYKSIFDKLKEIF